MEDFAQLVRVTVDGAPAWVPREVFSWGALRDALGVEGDGGVAIEVETVEFEDGTSGSWAVLGWGAEDVPGEVVRHWEFEQGQTFRTVTPGERDSGAGFVEVESIAPVLDDDADPDEAFA